MPSLNSARMGTKELKVFCALDKATKELLKMAMVELNFSARAYDRILKVARTIANGLFPNPKAF
jgi:magnesium chelatase family protein